MPGIIIFWVARGMSRFFAARLFCRTCCTILDDELNHRISGSSGHCEAFINDPMTR
jgi:hypothetical protein